MHHKFEWLSPLTNIYMATKYLLSGSCGGNFTAKNGHLSSPSYPNNYPPHQDCIYTISLPTDSAILLNFFTFDVNDKDNCKASFLEIREGPSDASTLLGKICGYEIPDPIQSNHSQLWMKWGLKWYTVKWVRKFILDFIPDSALMRRVTVERDSTWSTLQSCHDLEQNIIGHGLI